MPTEAQPEPTIDGGGAGLGEVPGSSTKGWWPLADVIKTVERPGSRKVVAFFFAAVIASVAAGIAVVRFNLSALPVPLGIATVEVTIYPPLFIGMLLFLWLGPAWAIVATYVATFALGAYAGLPVTSNLAFALADPVLFLVVWGGVTVLDMPSDIRTRPHLAFFLALVLTGAAASSLGALVWNHSHSLPFDAGLDIWEGWVVGAFLHGGLLVLPVHYFLGARVRTWLEHELQAPPRRGLGPRGGAALLLFALVLVAGIAAIVLRLLLGDLTPTQEPATVLAARLPELLLFLALVFVSLLGTTVLLTIALTRRSERELALARRDGLTGCLNRVAFAEIYPSEASRSVRLARPLAIVFVDLDHFKQINDNFGYATGDYVLREVAARMRSGIRDTDYLFRWGGEEFLLLLPHSTSQEAEQLAERIRGKIKMGAFEHVAKQISVTASLGIAATTRSEDTSLAIVDRAANACRRAKEMGRDRIEVADSETGALEP